MNNKSIINNSIFFRKTKNISIVLIALIIIVFLIQMYGKAYRSDGFDFTSYLISSKAFYNGANPYNTGSPFPYIYPLFLAVLLIPMTLLPYWFSLLVWFSIGILSFYYSAIFTLKINKGLFDFNQSLLLGIPLLLLILFLINPIQNNLLNGQINLLVLLLTVLFFYFYIRDKILLASFFLAMAISIKIVPLIFLVLIFRKKGWLLLLYSSLFAIIFCIVLPYIIQGTKIYDYYGDYINKFIVPGIKNNFAVNDQSLFFTFYGFIIYLFSSLIKITILKVICSIILIAVLMIIIYKAPSEKFILNAPYLMSIIFLSILLINPISETHHLIFILPSLSLILYRSLITRIKMNKKKYLLLILFIVTFWIGGLLKTGAYYFISLCVLYLIMIDNIAWKNKYE